MPKCQVNQRVEYAISEEESSNGKVVCIHDDHILVLDDFGKNAVTVPMNDVLTILDV